MKTTTNRFVRPPFSGWVRRKKVRGGYGPYFNYVDNLFWKHFQTMLKRGGKSSA